MTVDNRRENLVLELEKGEADFQAVRVLLEAGLWDAAVGRAYYGAFHFVSALLLSIGVEARSHHGTHDLLYMHFVRPGLVPARISKLFAGLQKYREQADYSRMFRFEEADARDEIANAEEIRAKARELLLAGGWISE